MTAYKSFLIMAATAALGGCTASVTNPEGSSPSTTADLGRPVVSDNAEMASFAAKANRPAGDAEHSEFTALINENGSIRIINPTDRAIENAVLWADGHYVAQLPEIRSRSTITVNRSQLYNRDGKTIDFAGGKIERLELQIGERLYRVNGPAWINH